MHLPRIPSLALTLAILDMAGTAHAGPTVSADLDLGTVTRSPPGYGSTGFHGSSSQTPALYAIGLGVLRAGWRFDVGPVWLLPEIGVRYTILRVDTMNTGHEGRVAVGGRVGWSGAIRPDLRFEPAIYGHVGVAWFPGTSVDGSELTGPALDVGLSLDLRIRKRFLVGAQVGYNAVILSIPTLSYPSQETVDVTPPVAYPWVSYGIHAGYLFW